jgi:hypothetical protein
LHGYISYEEFEDVLKQQATFEQEMIRANMQLSPPSALAPLAIASSSSRYYPSEVASHDTLTRSRARSSSNPPMIDPLVSASASASATTTPLPRRAVEFLDQSMSRGGSSSAIARPSTNLSLISPSNLSLSESDNNMSPLESPSASASSMMHRPISYPVNRPLMREPSASLSISPLTTIQEDAGGKRLSLNQQQSSSSSQHLPQPQVSSHQSIAAAGMAMKGVFRQVRDDANSGSGSSSESSSPAKQAVQAYVHGKARQVSEQRMERDISIITPVPVRSPSPLPPPLPATSSPIPSSTLPPAPAELTATATASSPEPTTSSALVPAAPSVMENSPTMTELTEEDVAAQHEDHRDIFSEDDDENASNASSDTHVRIKPEGKLEPVPTLEPQLVAQAPTAIAVTEKPAADSDDDDHSVASSDASSAHGFSQRMRLSLPPTALMDSKEEDQSDDDTDDDDDELYPKDKDEESSAGSMDEEDGDGEVDAEVSLYDVYRHDEQDHALNWESMDSSTYRPPSARDE